VIYAAGVSIEDTPSSSLQLAGLAAPDRSATVTRHLDTIVELQTDLTALRNAEQLLNGIPDWMEALHEEHLGKRTEIEEHEAEMEEQAHQRRAAEDGVADCQVRLKRYQEQISSVRTQREYGALLKEIDETKEEIKGHEENALVALESYEEAEKIVADLRTAFADLDSRYDEAQVKWETEKPEVAATATGLRERIETLRERLSRGDLSLFQRLFDRHSGEALATIRMVERSGSHSFYHCSACNFRVRPQVVVEIRNQGTVVLCDSCKRILHFQDEATD